MKLARSPSSSTSQDEAFAGKDDMSDGESKPVKGEAGEEGSAEHINLKVKGQVLAPPAASAHARLALCALLALLLSRATFASLLALG